MQQVGVTCKDIELHRPIKTVDPELEDVDNMKTLLYGFVGSISRTLGKENVFTQKFDELYGKYNIDIVNDLQNEMTQNSNIDNATGDSSE